MKQFPFFDEMYISSKMVGHKIELRNEELTLLPQKAIYWESRKILLLSDMHFGKVMHFRKAGIAVPKDAIKQNWTQLIYLLDHYEISRLLLLGDLFHSVYNSEWEEFQDIVVRYNHISFELILGNHDIMELERYESLKLMDELIVGPFVCTHEPLKTIGHHYNICGHIHPGIRLKGQARQTMRLPCFYFGDSQGILPAFGAFTGLKMMKAAKNDRIFVIVGNSVISVV